MSVGGVAFTGDWHTQNKTWSAVDAYTISHLHPPSRPNSETLLAALRHSRDEGLPDIASYPVLSKFFALQCRALKAKHALEVGTLGGYTSIWLTTENPDLRVTTVEFDPHHAAVARANLERAGVSDRVDVREGAGVDVLPALAKEIASGQLPRLDFVYIDADKANNWHYMDLAIGMCSPGAVLCIDNIVQAGRLVTAPADEGDHEGDDDGVPGARRAVEGVGADPRVDGVVLQTVGEKSYDGVLMVVVR
ncbi:O-methyltransferase [Xylariaceae sp. FL0804]|nr:O-methyltransferase [Xylariaceae sp. FL0804]